MNRIKGLIAMAWHHKRCTLGLDQFFLVSIWKLYLMCAHNIGSETAVQDDGIPDHFITSFLTKSALSIFLSPALQECESHGAKEEISHANLLTAGTGINGAELATDERNDSCDSPRRLGRS